MTVATEQPVNTKSTIKLVSYKPKQNEPGVYRFDRYATRGEIERQVEQVLKEIPTDQFDGEYNLSAYDIAESCSLYYPYNRDDAANLGSLIVAPSHGASEGEIIRLIGCNKDGEFVELMGIKFISGDMDFVWKAARALAEAIYEGQFEA